MMSSQEDYDRLLDDLKAEFSDFEVINKNDSGLMKVIDICLKTLTLGQMKTFMTSFITTLGNKVYVPASWNSKSIISKIEIMRHERVHMRQSKKYGRFVFSVLYLFVPLPCVLAYFRKKFEMEAYEESMRALYQYKGADAFTPQLKEFYVSQFTTANYFWMWPFRKGVELWFDDTVKKIKLDS